MFETFRAWWAVSARTCGWIPSQHMTDSSPDTFHLRYTHWISQMWIMAVWMLNFIRFLHSGLVVNCWHTSNWCDLFRLVFCNFWYSKDKVTCQTCAGGWRREDGKCDSMLRTRSCFSECSLSNAAFDLPPKLELGHILPSATKWRKTCEHLDIWFFLATY